MCVAINEVKKTFTHAPEIKHNST